MALDIKVGKEDRQTQAACNHQVTHASLVLLPACPLRGRASE
jgi:hypothetical protein